MPTRGGTPLLCIDRGAPPLAHSTGGALLPCGNSHQGCTPRSFQVGVHSPRPSLFCANEQGEQGRKTEEDKETRKSYSHHKPLGVLLLISQCVHKPLGVYPNWLRLMLIKGRGWPHLGRGRKRWRKSEDLSSLEKLWRSLEEQKFGAFLCTRTCRALSIEASIKEQGE